MKFSRAQIAATSLAPLFAVLVLVAFTYLEEHAIIVTTLMVWTSVLLLRSAFPKYFSKKYTLYVVNSFALLVLLNIGSFLNDVYLDYKLYQFDINHDLIFSPEEQTAEQQEYWMRVIGDGGRNVFRPILTLFVSLVSSILLAFLVDSLEWRKRRAVGRHGDVGT
jgi:hypothetical protein